MPSPCAPSRSVESNISIFIFSPFLLSEKGGEDSILSEPATDYYTKITFTSKEMKVTELPRYHSCLALPHRSTPLYVSCNTLPCNVRTRSTLRACKIAAPFGEKLKGDLERISAITLHQPVTLCKPTDFPLLVTAFSYLLVYDTTKMGVCQYVM